MVRDGLAFPLGVAHAAAFSLKSSLFLCIFILVFDFVVGFTSPFLQIKTWPSTCLTPYQGIGLITIKSLQCPR